MYEKEKKFSFCKVKCRGNASYGAYGLKKCRNAPKEDEFDRENFVYRAYSRKDRCFAPL